MALVIGLCPAGAHASDQAYGEQTCGEQALQIGSAATDELGSSELADSPDPAEGDIVSQDAAPQAVAPQDADGQDTLATQAIESGEGESDEGDSADSAAPTSSALQAPAEDAPAPAEGAPAPAEPTDTASPAVMQDESSSLADEPPTTYGITISAENGTATADKEQAAEGDTVTLTLTPNEGYELKALNYSVAHEMPVDITGSTSFEMPAQDVTVHAYFSSTTAQTYRILVGSDVNLEHGTVAVFIGNDPNKARVFTSENIPHGGADFLVDEEVDLIYVMIIPDSGYELKYSNVLDAAKNQLNTKWPDELEGEIWFSDPIADRTILICPAFREVPAKHEVQVGTETELVNGKVIIENVDTGEETELTETGSAQADEGQSIKVTFVPDDGYDLDPTSATATIVGDDKTEDVTLTPTDEDYSYTFQMPTGFETGDYEIRINPKFVEHEHDWGEWVVTKEPTATEDGEETRTCKTNASHTETRAIPAKGADAPVAATLIFDLAGGTLDGKTGTITVEANVGDTIKLPGAPTREGHTFKLWRGSEYAAGADYVVEGDHTFTAEWEKAEQEKASEPSPSNQGGQGGSASNQGGPANNQNPGGPTSASASAAPTATLPHTGDDGASTAAPLALAACGSLAAIAGFAALTLRRRNATR